MKSDSCLLCGESKNTHKCGDDFMCDRCCINIMDAPNHVSDWIDKFVIPHAIRTKRALIVKQFKMAISKRIFLFIGGIVTAFTIVMIACEILMHLGTP